MDGDKKSFGRGKWWFGQLVQLVIMGLLFLVWFGSFSGGVFSSTQGAVEPVSGNIGIKIGVTAGLICLAWAVHFYTAVRRYRDIGRSGLWVLTGFIPYIGPLIEMVHLGGIRGVSKPGSKPRFGESAHEPVDLSAAGYFDIDAKIAAMKRRSQLPEPSNTSPIVTSAPRQTTGGPVQRHTGFGRRGLD
jgi:uncharacterized membrane protein YhaH (DUF805 family)